MAALGPRVTFALTHPAMPFRKLRGLPTMEVDLGEMARYMPPNPVIIEAGAADGSDTVHLAEAWPDAQIYAFEPIPSAYLELTAKVDGYSNIHTAQVALGSANGRQSMHVSEDATGAPRSDSSSLLPPGKHTEHWPSIVFRETLEVDVTTLDAWREDSGVQHVDLMWLDMQGMELATLQASPATVENTGAVYMEAWRERMYEGAPVYDEIAAWMSQSGFEKKIDRVHRVFGNVLFVRR